MVRNALYSHKCLESVEEFCGASLKAAVAISCNLYAIYNLVSLQKEPYHLLNGIKVVLKVYIHCNYSIAFVAGCADAGHCGVILSGVLGQRDASKARILLAERFYLLPGGVLACIIYA